MSKAPFPSLIQRMIYCQIGSGKHFLGPARLHRVGMLKNAVVYSHVNTKTKKVEVVKI
jgi:hypothetical protein